MATTQQLPDPIDSASSTEPSRLDAEPNPISIENLTEQPPSAKEDKTATDVSRKVNTKDLRDAPGQLGSENVEGNQTTVYVSNLYSPQAQTVFYGGYDNWPGEWEEYTRYVNAEGLEVGSAGVYNENHSLMYPSGFGYSPQMPYGPYSPATTPLPPVSGDGQLFSPHHFPFSGPFYQQPAPSSLPYLSSPAPLPHHDLPTPVDQQGAFLADTSSANGMIAGPRPGYQLSFGSFERDWMKSPDGTGSAAPLLSPAASPQPMLFGQSNIPGMVPQQHRPFYGFGSSINSFDRGYAYPGLYPGNTSGVPYANFGIIGRSSNTIDKNRKREKGNASLCSCNGSVDFLNEQNRGPRANKPKNQTKGQNSSNDDENDSSTAKVDSNLYNSPDFVTDYKDAKFFIIKSYSEDNVHKSIKYGVWASTSNGNRKLDSAYREAKEKEEHCPVFLFFSVNASAQFCGVAEMIGPVDFEKSVDYWQQDKWSGQFPVKWHIVKDVPNNLFRHILLENNDNKPVTNSRDTQEVKLEQGLEMLNIFKKHEHEASILDDFEFYEDREKAMQERKSRQQQLLSSSTGAIAGEPRHLGAISGNTINQMTKTFAEAVRLEERSITDSAIDISNSVSTEETKKQTNVAVARNC